MFPKPVSIPQKFANPQMTREPDTSYNKLRVNGDHQTSRERSTMSRIPACSAKASARVFRMLAATALLGGLWPTGALSIAARADEPSPIAPKPAPLSPVAQPPLAKNLQPLNRQATVLLDKTGRRILLKGQVALREGALELFCCPKQTKEHESILSVDAKAYVIHAGLLALGARPGKPAAFNPTYRAPTGQKIDIFVNWTDADGKPRHATGQSWVRRARQVQSRVNRHRIRARNVVG
jgi:hypothetical protein